jgi:hypothetical protein
MRVLNYQTDFDVRECTDIQIREPIDKLIRKRVKAKLYKQSLNSLFMKELILIQVMVSLKSYYG